MCGGSFGRLFQNSGKIFGLDVVGTKERAANKAAENSPEAQQSKQDNAQAAMKKRRASEVLSGTDSNKKSTLGG